MIAINSAVRFLRWLGFALLSLVTACAFVEVNEPMVQLKDEKSEKFGIKSPIYIDHLVCF